MLTPTLAGHLGGPPLPQTNGKVVERIVDDMLAEFDRYARHGSVAIADEPPFRRYAVGRASYRLLRLAAGAPVPSELAPGDTLLHEGDLGADLRVRLREARVHWLELGGKTRSRDGSPLTEELALFLNRYGIRLPRDS